VGEGKPNEATEWNTIIVASDVVRFENGALFSGALLGRDCLIDNG
jgi:hypothetical protein